jgi:hypothetical protein
LDLYRGVVADIVRSKKACDGWQDELAQLQEHFEGKCAANAYTEEQKQRVCLHLDIVKIKVEGIVAGKRNLHTVAQLLDKAWIDQLLQ